MKSCLSIGTWFHWYLKKTPLQTSMKAENGDEKIPENCYYFQYRLGETYGTSQKSIPFRNNVWQKKIYYNKIDAGSAQSRYKMAVDCRKRKIYM